MKADEPPIIVILHSLHNHDNDQHDQASACHHLPVPPKETGLVDTSSSASEQAPPIRYKHKILFSQTFVSKNLKCTQQAFFSPRTPLSLQFPEGGICNKPRKVLVVGSIPKRSRRNLEALVKVNRYHHPICWCALFIFLLFFVVDVSSKDDCSQTLT